MNTAIQTKKISKKTFEEIFHPTGAKIVSYNERLYGGTDVYEIEIAKTMLEIGEIQLGRLGFEGFSVFQFAIVPRGNKQVVHLEFMQTCDYINHCAQTAKSCGDIQ